MVISAVVFCLESGFAERACAIKYLKRAGGKVGIHLKGGEGLHQLQKLPSNNALQMLNDGRQIFRHDTFGNEVFWGGSLRLHEAIAGAANGGVGGGVSPAIVLAIS